MMRDKLLYKIYVCSLFLPALLPLKILYLISDGIYVLAYWVFHYRRTTVMLNLQRSFPEKSIDELRHIERKFYRHLCDCIVETVKLLHISDREIDRRIEITNGEFVEQVAANGKSIILFLGHYGNWEWVQAIPRHFTRPALCGQIYKPQHNSVTDKVVQKIRSRFPNLPIPQKKAIRTLLKLRQEGRQFIIGFIADQRPNSSSTNHWTTFLNQETVYVTGGEEIGKHIDANYLYLDIEKTKRGHYRMTFKPIEPTPEKQEMEYPYTLQFMQMLETTIRRSPEYWLWSHKRWKFSQPNTLETNFKKK